MVSFDGAYTINGIFTVPFPITVESEEADFTNSASVSV